MALTYFKIYQCKLCC